jgi:hypothetical protein
MSKRTFDEWDVKCPKCEKTLSQQTSFVTELRDPKFTCRFCDVKGVLIARDGQSKLEKGK